MPPYRISQHRLPECSVSQYWLLQFRCHNIYTTILVLPYDVTLPGVTNTFCHYTVYTVNGVTMQIVATQFVTEYSVIVHGVTIQVSQSVTI